LPCEGTGRLHRQERIRGGDSGVTGWEVHRSSRKCTVFAPGMYWMGVHLDKISASQRAATPRQSAVSLQTHAFSAPQTGKVSPHRERSSLEAFLRSTVRAPIDAANGRMSSPHPRKRWRYVSPGASGLATGTATNRHCRPTRDWPTFNGRLEVECGRSAGGSPPAVGGWPRGTIGSLGADCPLF
jgi:hypothetical protein